ncbi:UNVERIFIED_CONTAM: hypothetical protein K2H54_003609 [Gekko kuhli]
MSTRHTHTPVGGCTSMAPRGNQAVACEKKPCGNVEGVVALDMRRATLKACCVTVCPRGECALPWPPPVSQPRKLRQGEGSLSQKDLEEEQPTESAPGLLPC